MADTSALLSDAREEGSALQQPSIKRVTNQARAYAILHQLYSWRWSWEARNRNAVFEKAAQDGNVFDTSLHFDHPYLLYDILLYDALLILVLRYLEGRNHPSQLQEPIRPAGPLIRPDQIVSVQQPAIEICRCLDYQMLYPGSFAPIHQWALPLALAYITLPPTSPIAQWVRSRVDTAPERFSIPWSLYVDRLRCQDPDHSWATPDTGVLCHP